MRVFLVPVLVVLGSLGFACSSDEKSGPTCSDYSPPPGFDATAPVKKFSTDVFPILKASCATTSCHGAPNNEGHVLISGDAATTYAGLVNIPSVKLPSMVYVKPNDARESFMMRKLDGSHCVLDKQCTGGTCGEAMPNKEAQLSLDERDTIRRWISQGAKND